MLKNNVLGGVLIVAGTTIGGGMLALPIVSAFSGFSVSLLVLILMWALMTYTALVTLEINLYFKKGVSVAYAAQYTFGRLGYYISTAAIAVLFYALLSAYLSASTSILDHTFDELNFQIPHIVTLGLFAFVFTGIVVAETGWVDKSSRLLLLIKAMAFILIAIIILPNTKLTNLKSIPDGAYTNLLLLIPLFFTSFGFHGSISTIVTYIGTDWKKLRFTFVLGSLLPLAVYIIWELIALGSVPLSGPNSFEYIKNTGGDLGTFTGVLSDVVQNNNWLGPLSKLFTFLAIATSFLGVGIGLYHFMEEQITKQAGNKPTALTTWLFTFVLPILFAGFYPQGFIMALGYAAIALSTLAVIMPTLIALKLRKQYSPDDYQVAGGSLALIIALIAGICVIVLEISST